MDIGQAEYSEHKLGITIDIALWQLETLNFSSNILMQIDYLLTQSGHFFNTIYNDAESFND